GAGLRDRDVAAGGVRLHVQVAEAPQRHAGVRRCNGRLDQHDRRHREGAPEGRSHREPLLTRTFRAAVATLPAASVATTRTTSRSGFPRTALANFADGLSLSARVPLPRLSRPWPIVTSPTAPANASVPRLPLTFAASSATNDAGSSAESLTFRPLRNALVVIVRGATSFTRGGSPSEVWPATADTFSQLTNASIASPVTVSLSTGGRPGVSGDAKLLPQLIASAT